MSTDRRRVLIGSANIRPSHVVHHRGRQTARQQDHPERVYDTTTPSQLSLGSHRKMQAVTGRAPLRQPLRTPSFILLKKEFEKNTESSMEIPAGISSALLSQQFPFGSIFFSFITLFLTYGIFQMLSIALLL